MLLRFEWFLPWAWTRGMLYTLIVWVESYRFSDHSKALCEHKGFGTGSIIVSSAQICASHGTRIVKKR